MKPVLTAGFCFVMTWSNCVFLLPLDEMLSYCRVTHNISGTHYTHAEPERPCKQPFPGVQCSQGTARLKKGTKNRDKCNAGRLSSFLFFALHPNSLNAWKRLHCRRLASCKVRVQHIKATVPLTNRLQCTCQTSEETVTLTLTLNP